MACQRCFNPGKTDYNWDNGSNILYYNNGGCSNPTSVNTCFDNTNRISGCTLCTGCAYSGTNGSGQVTCYTNGACTVPCSSVPELGDSGVFLTPRVGAMGAGTWLVAVLLVVFLGGYLFRKRFR